MRETGSQPEPFNEAGAFLLRKRTSATPTTMPISAFNEAGAFLLRKQPHATRAVWQMRILQ